MEIKFVNGRVCVSAEDLATFLDVSVEEIVDFYYAFIDYTSIKLKNHISEFVEDDDTNKLYFTEDGAELIMWSLAKDKEAIDIFKAAQINIEFMKFRAKNCIPEETDIMIEIPKGAKGISFLMGGI